MSLELIVFAFCAILGIVPCYLWGRYGGDGTFTKKYPKLVKFCHFLHHWEVGLALMVVATVLMVYVSPWWVALLSAGFGIAFEDCVFHSFGNYFATR